jgi:hypothetical protein
VVEGSVVLKVLDEYSAETGNTLLGLLTEVELIQTIAIFGVAFSTDVIVSLVPDMAKKYSVTRLRLKG